MDERQKISTSAIVCPHLLVHLRLKQPEFPELWLEQVSWFQLGQRTLNSAQLELCPNWNQDIKLQDKHNFEIPSSLVSTFPVHLPVCKASPAFTGDNSLSITPIR